jgi:hypothetical protein
MFVQRVRGGNIKNRLDLFSGINVVDAVVVWRFCERIRAAS